MLKKINLKINFEGRIFGLDLLRAFAILTVVYCHGYPFLREVADEKMYMNFFINGVTVFFVLSGFLVGSIFLRQINTDLSLIPQLWHFWKRRWWRTLPNYFLMLTFLVVYFDRLHGYSYYHSIKYFFFFQNMFQTHPAFFGEAWSLAVEEWFYLLFPLTFVFYHKWFKLNKKQSLMFLIISFTMLPLLIRIIGHFKMPLCDAYAYEHFFSKLVFMRLDSIMIGVAGAYWQYYYSDSWLKAKSIWWLGLLVALGTHIIHIQQTYSPGLLCFFDRTIGFSLMSFGVLLMIPYLSALQPQKLNIGHKSVMFISLISYSMYLVNLTMFKSIFGPIFNNIFDGFGLDILLFSYLKYTYYWLLVILLSYFMYVFWERPMMSFRDR